MTHELLMVWWRRMVIAGALSVDESIRVLAAANVMAAVERRRAGETAKEEAA